MKSRIEDSKIVTKINHCFWKLHRGTPVSLGKIQRDKIVGILYLDAKERKNYELMVTAGEFFQGGTKIKDAHLLFGLNQGQFYGKLGFEWKNYGRGYFGHGSFLSGGYLNTSGEFLLQNGKLRYITSNSGHYLPTNRHMRIALYYLYRRGVDLSEVVLVLYKHQRSSPVARGRYLTADFYNALEFLQNHENNCKKLNDQSVEFKKDIKFIREQTNRQISEPTSPENFKPHRLSSFIQPLLFQKPKPKQKRQLHENPKFKH